MTWIINPLTTIVKLSLVFLTSGHSNAQGSASECPDVKSYKSRLNPVCHRMLYSCTHVATVGVKGLTTKLRQERRNLQHATENWIRPG